MIGAFTMSPSAFVADPRRLDPEDAAQAALRIAPGSLPLIVSGRPAKCDRDGGPSPRAAQLRRARSACRSLPWLRDTRRDRRPPARPRPGRPVNATPAPSERTT